MLDLTELTTDNQHANAIRINEVSPLKSKDTNEFGNQQDWVEFMNYAKTDITLQAGSWFLSDEPSKPDKFELPEIELAAGEFLRIWCDGENVHANDVHTNFKLSAKGEVLTLTFKQDNNFVLIDKVAYGPQLLEGMSLARIPDGIGTWKENREPSPLTSNLLSQ